VRNAALLALHLLLFACRPVARIATVPRMLARLK
jgi:hypothetical protein